MTTTLSFHDVEAQNLSEGELNALPFGAIKLDAQGRILFYNVYESTLTAVKPEEAVGKNFFTEVAPCTNVQGFYGRFQEGVAQKNLHTSFNYTFTHKMAPTDVNIRMSYDAAQEAVWVFVRKRDA